MMYLNPAMITSLESLQVTFFSLVLAFNNETIVIILLFIRPSVPFLFTFFTLILCLGDLFRALTGVVDIAESLSSSSRGIPASPLPAFKGSYRDDRRKSTFHPINISSLDMDFYWCGNYLLICLVARTY